jgi:hypothetical protein
VLVGRRTLNKTTLINHLIVFEQDELNKTYLFRYNKKLPSKLKESCAQFEFYLENINEVLFIDQAQIFKFNFINLEVQIYFKF